MERSATTPNTCLEVLKTLWSFPPAVLLQVANWSEGYIDQANEYLDYMDGAEIDDPAEAWEEWCIDNDIEHEIENNPFKL